MGLGLSIMFGGGGGAGVAPPAAPTLSGLPDLSVQTGTGVTVNCAGYATGSGLIWTMTGPAELAINQLTGQITGTAGAAGTGTVTVTATNGGGSASDSFTMTVTAGSGATAPDQVTDLTATAGDAQVALSWTAPANGGSAITDYLIEVNSGSGWSTVSDGVGTGTSYTHTGLTNGTAYTYRVSAINSIGTGAASATASVTPVASSPLKVAAVPVHFFNNMTNSTLNTTLKSWNSRAPYTASGDLQEVRVAFQQNVSSTYSGVDVNFAAASLEYPVDVFYPITVGGSESFFASKTAWNESDPIYVSIPKGATFWIRVYTAVGTQSTMSYANIGTVDGGLGSGSLLMSTTEGDLTKTAGSSKYTMQNAAYRPIVLGRGTNMDPFVYLIGDSIMAGTGDTVKTLGRLGIFQRSLPRNLPHFNGGIGGSTWGNWNSSATVTTKKLIEFADHIVSNFGINEIIPSPNRTVSSFMTAISTMWASSNWVGKTKTQLTLTPYTSSTDGWVTEANQTAIRTGGTVDLNAAILAGGYGADRTVDVGSILLGADTSKWMAPGGVAQTGDGIHPNTTGYLAVVDSGIINANTLFGFSG